MNASIMEIERFAIHDGPGIRTVVFLQGCPLHCPWCANPESQSIKPQLMYQKKRCVTCGTCVKNCPAHAVDVQNNEIRFYRDRCLSCKTCEQNCPAAAIQFIGTQMTVEEIMNEVRKDKCFYNESDGGVTISGGEPFVQFEVCKSILNSCKNEGISTAVETTGDTKWRNMEECLSAVDLFLFDFKHYDSEKLQHVTGANADRIMANLKHLAYMASEKIILRIPVIPGFNYEDDVLKKMLDIALQLKISRVHLLPYHTLGLSKYEQLDRTYALKGTAMLHKEDLQSYVAYGNHRGLYVQAGG